MGLDTLKDLLKNRILQLQSAEYNGWFCGAKRTRCGAERTDSIDNSTVLL